MARKEKTATEKLNLSLAGIDSALTIIATVIDNREKVMALLENARRHCEEARDHMTTIRFHLAQVTT